jgi:hypothetical protein
MSFHRGVEPVPKKMTAPVRFILLVIGIMIVAATLMVPRRDEWLAMMWDEKKQAQMIALLEPRLARGDNDPDLLATLGRCYAAIHNYPRAIELLERYITLRPDDGGAYASLADLYKNTGDVTRQIAMLKRSIAITPALMRALELAILYREGQRPDEELALLSRFEAELRAAAAQSTDNGDVRLFLAKLLVGSGRSAEAVRLGKQWILEWHEPWLADRLLRGIVLQAPAADASELADAVAVAHPEIRFFLVAGLATMGAKPVARHLLESWIKATRSPSMIEIAAFLSACRDQDEQDIVWQVFGEVLRPPLSTDLITRFSEAIAAEFGIGALAPFWAILPQTAIDHQPLFAARLAFHEHDLAMTRLLLEKVDIATLDPSDRRMWVDLLTAVASLPEVFEALRDRRRSGRLPPDLLARYARLAGELGQEIEYRAALAGMRGKGGKVD